MPIIFVRSSMIINKPLIMVTPATAIINAKIIQTFMSSKSNHEKMAGLDSMIVSDEYVSP